MDEIREKISKEVEALVFKKVEFTDSLVHSKLLDSISVIDLAVSLEELFNIEITNTDIKEENFDTIEKLTSFIEAKLKV